MNNNKNLQGSEYFNNVILNTINNLNVSKNEMKILEEDLLSLKNEVKQLKLQLAKEKQEKDKLKLENDNIKKYGKFINFFN